MRAFSYLAVALAAATVFPVTAAFGADAKGPSSLSDLGSMSGPGARSQDPAEQAIPLPKASEETPKQQVDKLFDQLKREASADKAEGIASKIETVWHQSGSVTIDLLMQWTAQAIDKKNNAAAFDLLDQIVTLKPDYAEAWNLRATLHFTLSEYGKSLSDIQETLRREPRHFGALMGLAMILEQTGKKQDALDTYMRVLSIYPTLKSAQDAVGRLSDDLAGQAI